MLAAQQFDRAAVALAHGANSKMSAHRLVNGGERIAEIRLGVDIEYRGMTKRTHFRHCERKIAVAAPDIDCAREAKPRPPKP
ncbi:hypothetical protein D3C83_174550 [compost metagenome]